MFNNRPTSTSLISDDSSNRTNMASTSLLFYTIIHALYSIFHASAVNPLEARQQPLPAQVPRCRFIPTDPEWPSTEQWGALNTTVSGRLIATVPLGAPCYKSTYDVKTGQYDLSTYDQALCEKVQKGWHEPAFHEESSSSVMQTFFANNSCNPIADQSEGRCGIGNYVQYAIDVTGDEDVKVCSESYFLVQ